MENRVRGRIKDRVRDRVQTGVQTLARAVSHVGSRVGSSVGPRAHALVGRRDAENPGESKDRPPASDGGGSETSYCDEYKTHTFCVRCIGPDGAMRGVAVDSDADATNVTNATDPRLPAGTYVFCVRDGLCSERAILRRSTNTPFSHQRIVQYLCREYRNAFKQRLVTPSPDPANEWPSAVITRYTVTDDQPRWVIAHSEPVDSAL
jgi:hypothetical protein